MPTYEYACTDCGLTFSLLQSHSEMVLSRDKQECPRCSALTQFVFPAPAPVSDTRRASHLGDGLEMCPRDRKKAYAAARRAGVNPNGKTFVPGLCRKGRRWDPMAWVDRMDYRSQVRKRCVEEGFGVRGAGKEIKPREALVDPDEKPYMVDPKITAREVQKVVDDHGGDVTPSERKTLFRTKQEQLSGRG